MENALYWIWLTSKPVLTPRKITSLLEYFGSVEEIYSSDEFSNIPNIGMKEISALREKSLSQARRISEKTESIGARIITFDDKDYPDKLRYITPPPYILYVRGDISGLDGVLTIGIIGTRRNTDYGKLAAARITARLAQNGAVIVSGLARGIDSVAAKETLKAGGRTIAVLGSGIDVIYPPENGALMDEVAKNGAVITEYPPGSPAASEHFPVRNRIIAGLSNGVLVAEAPARSGSLITARLAMEYGRDVFAVPGNITDINYEGANRLIQQGAKLTIRAEDILEEYPYFVKRTPETKRGNRTSEDGAREQSADNTPEAADGERPNGSHDGADLSDMSKFKQLTGTDERIVSLLMNKDMNTDELSRELEMSAGELNVKLTLLEMKGFIKKQAGGDYKIIV